MALNFSLRDRPKLVFKLDEFSPAYHPGKLLYQKAPFAAAPQPQFADELLVARFAARRAANPPQKVSVGTRVRCFSHPMRILGPAIAGITRVETTS
jgi:hypothetical protein